MAAEQYSWQKTFPHWRTEDSRSISRGEELPQSSFTELLENVAKPSEMLKENKGIINFQNKNKVV